jgi:predicted AAA+ superfamily ATPase
MSNPKKGSYLRAQADILAARLREPRRFLQIVTGPRQVGKTI